MDTKRELVKRAPQYNNLERIRINVDDKTFSKIHNTDVVRMHVYCLKFHDSIDFLLRNSDGKGTKKAFVDDVTVPVDEKTYISMINPDLKVTFCCGNALVPFSTISMAKEGIFAGRGPIVEQLMN